MNVYLPQQGYASSGKRVRRLMRLKGIQAIYTESNSNSPSKGQKSYPHPLRNLPIALVSQVWSADMTHVSLFRGIMYLVAVMDRLNRLIPAGLLSRTQDGIFWLDALHRALSKEHRRIFNTDQSAQVTADVFTACLLAADIQVSIAGRALDSFFCEPLWRSVR